MARKLGLVMLSIVLVASGTYLFVYLYRWEWNRAVIAGVFVIAAEIAIAATLILGKLATMEQRMQDRDRAPSFGAAEIRDDLTETAPPPRPAFKWLARSGDDLNVFVPVLMGAGIVLSGIAWLVERFARMTARPALEAGLVTRLAPLALPEGGFLAPVGASVPVERRCDWGRLFKLSFAALVVAAMLAMAVDELGDLTQNRPELDVPGRAGQLTLQISDHGWPRTIEDGARSLWSACLSTLPNGYQASGFVTTAPGQVTMLIVPKPGESAQRRLFGCLSDSTLDNLSASIVSFGSAAR
ncbi:MAG TPA: hypothetical protein VIG64_01740 [Actinomycetota bacterium]|jgi:hypothetical protein